MSPSTPEPAPAGPTPPELVEATRDGAALRRFLHGLPGVDQVGLEQRVAELATRSLKKDTKAWAIDTAIRTVDLTTLEGADTPGKIRALAAKARRPDPDRPDTPAVAALCVYPDMASAAVDALADTGVRVASVATAFPSGRAPLTAKLDDVRQAVSAGADEVDMVIDRGAFLTGDYGVVFDQIQQVRHECGSAHLKVILETGELATHDNVRRASWLAMLGGADFIKTSTGKVSPAATLPVTHVMLQAVRDWRERTGHLVGVKAAGGIRGTKEALRYLVAAHEVAGAAWLSPSLFRFGASSLLNDLLMQRRTQTDGHYSGPNYVAVD